MIKITNIENNKVFYQYVGEESEFNCHISLKEINTNTPIYTTKLILNPGINYWIQISSTTAKWVNNTLFEVIKDNKIHFTTVFNFKGESRDIVINSKKVQILSDYLKDNTYNTISEIFFDKIYERDYVKIEINDIIVDVGANIGCFSLYAQLFQPKKIYAFEPLESTFNFLKENLKNYDNIIFIQEAISDKKGESHIQLQNSSEMNILDKNSSFSRHDSTEFDIVKTNTFNNFIKDYNISHIDFLKVDCEGGELDLFTTIDKKFLSNNIKKIVLEYHTSFIKAIILDILHQSLFTIENITGNDIGMIYAYNSKFFQ